MKLKPPPRAVSSPSSSRHTHKGTISKWQINVAALKLAERQRKRKEGREGMEGGRDEAKKPDERVEWRERRGPPKPEKFLMVQWKLRWLL